VRLWDTLAPGSTDRHSKKTKPNENYKCNLGEMDSPPGGAALCVYRGHTLHTAVWDCSFCPAGYYFASVGSDTTGRIWTTDRITPVRILVGHTHTVNTLAWHPNCNYVLTGSEDNTVRMWDVQTGRCVRLLSGCTGGITTMVVSPSGRYASAADGRGVISIWDLGSGKKVNELKNNGHKGDVHSICYSACGSSLASGGADCVVRIWDVRGCGNTTTNPHYVASDVLGVAATKASLEPVRNYYTKNTPLLHLHYTKQNLLLCAGKIL